MAFCTKCGTRLAEGTKFCTLCGAVISNGRTDKPGERSSEPFKDVRTQPDHPPHHPGLIAATIMQPVICRLMALERGIHSTHL